MKGTLFLPRDIQGSSGVVVVPVQKLNITMRIWAGLYLMGIVSLPLLLMLHDGVIEASLLLYVGHWSTDRLVKSTSVTALAEYMLSHKHL